MDLIERAPSSVPLLFVFQRGYQRAAELSRLRATCNDRRSTLGWSDAQEAEWEGAVNDCREGEVVWVGTGGSLG